MNWVFIGLSITSSWGNGHATTFRSLLRALKRRGHSITFLECDVPWYAHNRDMPHPAFCTTHLYPDLNDLQERFESEVKSADVVVVGSYVREGVPTGQWVQNTAEGVMAFYDIDTPVTLAKLERGDYEYLSPELIPGYQLYLSFSGGRSLEILERQYGSPRARALYCSVDPEAYYPEPEATKWDLAYLGTYSDDRQPGLDLLLMEPARHWESGRFAVAGPQYPDSIQWPDNVERIHHLPPAEHRGFYNAQRFCLNITREDMKDKGHSPSVRLFEAAACGAPIISDWWEGLDEIFEPSRDIIIAQSAEDSLRAIQEMTEADRLAIGEGGRQRVLSEHTADHRAEQLEQYVMEVAGEPESTAEAEYAAQR